MLYKPKFGQISLSQIFFLYVEQSSLLQMFTMSIEQLVQLKARSCTMYSMSQITKHVTEKLFCVNYKEVVSHTL